MMTLSILAIVLCLGVILMLVVVAIVIALQNRQSENDATGSSFQSPSPPGGSRVSTFSPESTLYDQVKGYLRQGNRIEAIKAYREGTGASLAEARGAVEGIERSLQGSQSAGGSLSAGELRTRVVELLSQGRKIEAIKIYREATGEGLKEAKDAVDDIEKNL